MPGPGSRTRDSRPRPPSVCRLAACPPGPGHQFVGIRAGLHPQTGHHGVWSPRFVPFPPIHIIHSWCLWRPPGGCQQITKVWVILYCILARTVCSQLKLARSVSLWEDKLGLQAANSKHQRNQFRNWQWLYLGRVRERDIWWWAPGGGDVTTSHRTARQVTIVRLRQNYWSMTYGCGKLLLLLRYLNSTCVSQVVFSQNRHQRWNQWTLSRRYQWERSDKWEDIRSSSGVRATPRWKIYFRK